jgi:hypothetical protein
MYRSELPVNGLSECIDLPSQKKILAEGLPVSLEVIGKILKQDGWTFDWKNEFRLPNRKLGIACCLVAYMCKASFELGMDGYVAFEAKTVLIDHYIKKFGAELINPKQNRMCIGTENAEKLVNLYIKNLE